MLPVNRHGSDALALRPRLLRTAMILLYQWRGLLRRLYNVHVRSQYSSFLASESPMGGFTIVILLLGSMPWQNAFLQSPCLRVRQRSTAKLTMRRIISGQWTGACFSDLVHTRSSWLPSTTICDFSRSGFNILSFLMERTHMVGIAHGAPFAQRARYSARLILMYVFWDSIPDFSLQKLAIHVSQSGWVGWRPVRRECGHSRLRCTALTWDADAAMSGGRQGCWNDDGWWPGIRTPLTHRSCQVEVKLGRGIPHSLDFLLMWDLKLNWKMPSWDWLRKPL